MSQMISNKMINKPKQPRSYRYRIFVDEDESYRSLHDEHEESSGKGPSAPNIRKVYREPIDAQPKLMVSLQSPPQILQYQQQNHKQLTKPVPADININTEELGKFKQGKGSLQFQQHEEPQLYTLQMPRKPQKASEARNVQLLNDSSSIPSERKQKSGLVPVSRLQVAIDEKNKNQQQELPIQKPLFYEVNYDFRASEELQPHPKQLKTAENKSLLPMATNVSREKRHPQSQSRLSTIQGKPFNDIMTQPKTGKDFGVNTDRMALANNVISSSYIPPQANIQDQTETIPMVLSETGLPAANQQKRSRSNKIGKDAHAVSNNVSSDLSYKPLTPNQSDCNSKTMQSELQKRGAEIFPFLLSTISVDCYQKPRYSQLSSRHLLMSLYITSDNAQFDNCKMCYETEPLKGSTLTWRGNGYVFNRLVNVSELSTEDPYHLLVELYDQQQKLLADINIPISELSKNLYKSRGRLGKTAIYRTYMLKDDDVVGQLMFAYQKIGRKEEEPEVGTFSKIPHKSGWRSGLEEEYLAREKKHFRVERKMQDRFKDLPKELRRQQKQSQSNEDNSRVRAIHRRQYNDASQHEFATKPKRSPRRKTKHKTAGKLRRSGERSAITRSPYQKAVPQRKSQPKPTRNFESLQLSTQKKPRKSGKLQPLSRYVINNQSRAIMPKSPKRSTPYRGGRNIIIGKDIRFPLQTEDEDHMNFPGPGAYPLESLFSRYLEDK